MVWKRKKEDSSFLVVRNGDKIYTPFQCDLCWFRNLVQRFPNSTSQADILLLAYIRRVNLDALWSRTPGTISSCLWGARKILNASKELRFNPPFEPLGPWPVADNWGLRLAIFILKASQSPGKNNPKYTQYDSIQKIASSYSNHFEASRQGAEETWVLRTDYKNSFFTSCQTRSDFFVRFKEGLKNRMCREVKGDLALDYKILHKILFRLEREMLESSTTFERRHDILHCKEYLIYSGRLPNIYEREKEDTI